MPDDSDQQAIHKLIYDIKRDRRQAFCDDFIEYLGQKYNTREFIAGCTELHLVARRHKTWNAGPVWKPSWVDPLEKIADLITVNARQSKTDF
jgi:aspartate racemase